MAKKKLKKGDRVLVVEDYLPNIVSAVNALRNLRKKGLIEDMAGAGNYKEFLRVLDEFKPTLALSDATIPRDAGMEAEDLRDEISKELDKRGIPYIFVTKAPIKGTHDYNVTILEREGGQYKPFKEFDTEKKDNIVWEEAYRRLKKKIS